MEKNIKEKKKILNLITAPSSLSRKINIQWLNVWARHQKFFLSQFCMLIFLKEKDTCIAYIRKHLIKPNVSCVAWSWQGRYPCLYYETEPFRTIKKSCQKYDISSIYLTINNNNEWKKEPVVLTNIIHKNSKAVISA